MFSGVSRVYKVIAYQTFWRKGVSPSTPISNNTIISERKTTRSRCRIGWLRCRQMPTRLGLCHRLHMAKRQNGPCAVSERYIKSVPTPNHFILTLMAWAPSWNRAYGLWRSPIARRPCPQGAAAVCMGFGSCTVPIFSSPSTASLWARKAIFFFFWVVLWS